MKKQIIYIIKNENPYSFNLEEINRIFRRYDITIVPNIVANNQFEIQSFLDSQADENVEVLAVLQIRNKIKIGKTRSMHEIASINNEINLHSLIPAQDECIIHSYKIENGKLVFKVFDYTTEGYLTDNINNLTPVEEQFKNKFILKNSMLTYADLEKLNMKNTSQGIATSKFICDELYYSSPINLNFNPQKQEGTIDFRKDPADILINNRYFNNDIAIQYGITNLFHVVLNRGIFFRSPKNRREKNYWCPALNAGLPLVPKRDIVHEITYMAHDFSHFLIPDLLYTGTHSSQNQQVYIAYRMMSEAFTLVLADMVFVDSLKKSGFDYDYTKRKIYPLFEEFDIDLMQKNNFLLHIKKILRASVDYCLNGNDAGFFNLSKNYRSRSLNLVHFKNKYMKFFCEDFKWTRHNYNSFRQNSDEIIRWWRLVGPLRDMAQLDTETIEEFSAKIDIKSDCLIDSIFAELYQRVSSILMKQPVPIKAYGKRQFKAFFRYMMGQLLILIRYENVVREAKNFQKIIINYLSDIKNEIHIENINFCRNLLADFVDILLRKNLITYDDSQTFKEVFPVFEPCFAFYDEKLDFYRDLSSVAYESIYAN